MLRPGASAGVEVCDRGLDLSQPSVRVTEQIGVVEVTVAAMAHVDLLVLLPLGGDIRVPEDEDPELREAMDDALLELSDDPDLLGGTRVIEVTGDPNSRLAQVESAIADLDGR